MRWFKIIQLSPVGGPDREETFSSERGRIFHGLMSGNVVAFFGRSFVNSEAIM